MKNWQDYWREAVLATPYFKGEYPNFTSRDELHTTVVNGMMRLTQHERTMGFAYITLLSAELADTKARLQQLEQATNKTREALDAVKNPPDSCAAAAPVMPSGTPSLPPSLLRP